jgi:hypothetical protein
LNAIGTAGDVVEATIEAVYPADMQVTGSFGGGASMQDRFAISLEIASSP